MSVQVTPTSKGYEVRFGWDPVKVAAIKTIQNAYWKGQEKFWMVPRHRQAELDMFLEKFGVMTEPVIQMPEQIEDIPELPELTIDLGLKRDLFPFQKPGVAQMMKWKRGIIGDEMGLAKTATAIATAIGLKYKCCLVICTNIAKYNWQKEWMITAGKRSIILGVDSDVKWQLYYEKGMADVFIVNYDSLKKWFVKAGWKKPKGRFSLKDIPFKDCVSMFDCVIIDESHSVANIETLQSRFTRGIANKKEIVIELTGTLMVNKIKDIAHQLMVIDRLKDIVSHIPMPTDEQGRPTDFTGYSRFLNRYCNGGEGESNVRELRSRLFKICYFRRQKEEVMKDLPGNIRNVIYCDISNREEYDKYKSDFTAYLKELKASNNPQKERLLMGQMLVRLGNLRRIAARGKISAAKEYADQVLKEGNKIVIFAHHQDIIEGLREIYPKAEVVIGAIPDVAARERAIVNFQNNPNSKIIIVSNEVGGESITLTKAYHMLIVENPLTNAKLDQMIARTDRIGQVQKVMAAILLGRKTIDDYVYFDIVLKKRDLFRIVSGDEKGSKPMEMVNNLLDFLNSNSAA